MNILLYVFILFCSSLYALEDSNLTYMFFDNESGKKLSVIVEKNCSLDERVVTFRLSLGENKIAMDFDRGVPYCIVVQDLENIDISTHKIFFKKDSCRFNIGVDDKKLGYDISSDCDFKLDDPM